MQTFENLLLQNYLTVSASSSGPASEIPSLVGEGDFDDILLVRLYRRRPEIIPPSCSLLRELCYSEGSWPSYRRRTRSLLPPSQCSLSQQRPLHLILLDHMSDGVEVSMTGRALRNLAGEAGDRAGPHQKPLTVSISSDSNKRKVESRDNAPQAPRKSKRNF